MLQVFPTITTEEPSGLEWSIFLSAPRLYGSHTAQYEKLKYPTPSSP